MTVYYSESEKGFYVLPQFSGEIPEDAFEVPEEEYLNIVATQSAETEIQRAEDGHLRLVPRILDEAEIIANLKREARAALDKSDTTVCRCYEQGVNVPITWRKYREELRNIVGGSSVTAETILPVRPDYPEGT